MLLIILIHMQEDVQMEMYEMYEWRCTNADVQMQMYEFTVYQSTKYYHADKRKYSF